MHYRRIPTMLLVGASIWLFLTNHVLAQTHPGLITISVGSGSSQAETEAAETLVARMLDDGELDDMMESDHAHILEDFAADAGYLVGLEMGRRLAGGAR